MNIFILGATGRVGQEIVQKALVGNHHVTVLVRNTEKVSIQSESLAVLEGDALNEADVISSMAGNDVIISALNTDKNQVLSKSMPLIISAMEHHDITRIVTIGTAGILNSRTEPDVYRFQSSESKRRTTTAAEDHLAAYQILSKSSLDWTVVCPTYLPDGNEESNYRTEIDMLPRDGKRITVGDTAAFAYSLLFTKDFIDTRVGLAY